SNLSPGAYSVDEAVHEGWSLDSAVCTSSIQDTETIDSLELDANESITCTFNNTKQGKIIIEKQTNPNGDTTRFEFNPSWNKDNFFLSDDEQNDSGFLNPGIYSVEELAVYNWVQT